MINSKAGLSLVEVLVAAVLVGILGLTISKTQLATTSAIQKSDFASIMDQYHLETVIAVQGQNGIKELKTWLQDPSNTNLYDCMRRAGTNCTSLDGAEVLFDSTGAEISSRAFLKSGSLCTSGVCDGETGVTIIPSCRSATSCDGMHASVSTVAFSTAATAPKARNTKSYFSSFRLIASLDLDFSCTDSDQAMVGIDTTTRSAICSERPILECNNEGFPSDFEGLNSMPSETPCRKVLGFDAVSLNGLGAKTSFFSAGYRKIGLTKPVQPTTTEGALAQDLCQNEIFGMHTWSLGDRYQKTLSCPSGTTTRYSSTHVYTISSNHWIAGTRVPSDSDPAKAKWGLSQSVDWDISFDKKVSGQYSTISMPESANCCRERADLWEPTNIASRFSEEVDIDVMSGRISGQRIVPVDESSPTTVTYNFYDNSSNKLLEKSLPIDSVGSTKIVSQNLSILQASVVPQSTALGVSVVQGDNNALLVTEVVEAATITESSVGVEPILGEENRFKIVDAQNNVLLTIGPVNPDDRLRLTYQRSFQIVPK